MFDFFDAIFHMYKVKSALSGARQFLGIENPLK